MRYVHSCAYVDMGLRNPRDRMHLNSSILLDSVKGSLKCIHWIYIHVSYSIFLATFMAHNGSGEVEAPEFFLITS